MLLFKEKHILQQLNGYEKTWSIPELLTCYRPFSGEPFEVRFNAIFQLLYMAEAVYEELSEPAKLRYQFWNQLRPSRIQERKYEYAVTTNQTYPWELTVNSKGLFFKDLGAMYSQQAGTVYEQLYSDFWFYGPEMPLPDLDMRKKVVAQLQAAFLQDGPIGKSHFPLFEYPSLFSKKDWMEGDDVARDYVTLLPFGIEYARWNWHDGLVYTYFVSFERLLADQPGLERLIAPAIQAELLAHIGAKSDGGVAQPQEKNLTSRRIYMEKGGRLDLILEEHADDYRPEPGDEERWKAQLLADSSARLKTEDKQEVIQQLASTLVYHGVADVEEQLVEAAKTSNLKARQAIGVVLTELFNSDSGPAVTLSLLEFEHESDYWRDYVFSAMGRIRNNKAAQRFVIQCLKGDNEVHFKKAVGVIQLWGMHGDQALMNRELWLSLNWEDACAADPNFNRSLEKVIRIIQA